MVCEISLNGENRIDKNEITLKSDFSSLNFGVLF